MWRHMKNEHGKQTLMWLLVSIYWYLFIFISCSTTNLPIFYSLPSPLPNMDMAGLCTWLWNGKASGVDVWQWQHNHDAGMLFHFIFFSYFSFSFPVLFHAAGCSDTTPHNKKNTPRTIKWHANATRCVWCMHEAPEGGEGMSCPCFSFLILTTFYIYFALTMAFPHLFSALQGGLSGIGGGRWLSLWV